MDKISVIVPVYNVEKYLSKCVDSIIKQTYRNLEIILIDDGSPDNCGAICDEYAEKDNRIKVIHKPNGGLSDARNAGLDIATGEYIAFVDSDDYIAENMIEKLYERLIKDGSDMALCGFEYVNESYGSAEDNKTDITNCIVDEKGFFNEMYGCNQVYCVVAWNKLYKKALFENERYDYAKCHEDQFIIHRLVMKCNKISFLEDKLYFYLRRRDSIMGEDYSINRLDVVEAYINRSKAFYAKGWSRYVERSLAWTIGIFMRGYKILDRNDITIKKRMNELCKQYRKVYRKIALDKNISLKFKLKGAVFCLSPAIYKIISGDRIKKIRRRTRRMIELVTDLIRYAIRVRNIDVVLLDTPEHGNLGDHAIAISEVKFLRGLNKTVIELTANNINHFERIFAKFTGRKKTVIITGGGFLGHLWPNEEERVRRILKAFKKNKIIVFPQTITFDMETDNGRAYFEESKKIYSAHKNLILYVRENKSFELVKRYMPDVSVKLAPDIVTSFIPDIKKSDRTNILLCFRKDKESIYSDADQRKIYKMIERKYPSIDIKETNTVISKSISKKNRNAEVHNKLKEFSNAKLLITDRLHAMLFALITDTPCIAFGNSSGKVKGVYSWIEDNEYIKYVDDLIQFSNALDSIDIDRQYVYHHDNIDKALSILKEDILNT